ncbi:SDR family NAD(P)-dependent oxidoreductase [Sphingopyxis flava]|uniref:NAD(P)-dependent dehydrogenase, short-chain alcohol dehydrogenase family n=1 Tax=Sphingopyxis flava TaxID=1507287 RepID=A0A1T5E6T7_9SPHN|nr:SDR family oxidoreductase [Sphingopyxis flava]SKB79579.1 NAD(P)-dependent dehydrogenase, short-chain alcohol dehydrogenase family [Sphingopyxis flava]
MKLGIEGKRALVTCSDCGVGKDIALTLAAEGVHLVVHGTDRSATEGAVAAIIGDGGWAEGVVGDLSTAQGAAGVIETVLAKGGVDILVNNAGNSASTLPDWLSIPEAVWERSFSTNVICAVRTIRAFTPAMLAKGWGRIINISNQGMSSASSSIADHQASAAACVSLTVSLAQSLAGTGVTANVISSRSGPDFNGRGWRAPRMTAVQHKDIGYNGREYVGQALHLTDGATNSARQISAAVALLASELSDMTNGASLDVGGANALH